jgi:alpha,alpha-trehalase
MSRLPRTTLPLTLLVGPLLFACAAPPPAAGPARADAFGAAPVQYDPARDLGRLFHDVQVAGLFDDSKTFVDARALRPPAEIAAAYRTERDASGFDLRRFVSRHFSIPAPVGIEFQSDPSRTMEAHIAALWPVLTRAADAPDPGTTLIPLPHPYVVPGGRFREIYYWDSYFTMLGLVEGERVDLVRSMLDNFAHLVRTAGHIPNGNRTYYLSRSQPPYFAAMVGLYAEAADTTAALRYLDALEAEHAFWMDGADRVAPGEAHRRVVRLADGSVLNRYWDDRPEPRPESYREDHELGESFPPAQREAFYRNIRAAAESGWDFSSRWMRDPSDLRSIETTDLVPIDLNSLLYHSERTIAALRRFRAGPGDAGAAARFDAAADERRRALLAASYDPTDLFFYDVRWRTGERVRDRPTMAAAALLYFGLASPEQARPVLARLEREFLGPGGFVTTGIRSGEQWDAPNGWPPLQWLAIQGARRYGRADLATTAAERWLALNRRTYAATGRMMEKYDVLDPDRRAGGGEYPTQDGFGWSNGVALTLARGSLASCRAAPGAMPSPYVLSFPEPRLDDSAAYQGYRTRFYRDPARNTVQIYLKAQDGRVVTLLANAANESAGFTVRDAAGRPAALEWAADRACVAVAGDLRTVEYRVRAATPELRMGHFLLGSMRVERDFQYPGLHLAEFGPSFAVSELTELVERVGELPAPARARHLERLGATGVGELQSRLRPTIRVADRDGHRVAVIEQPSLDGRNRLRLEIAVPRGEARMDLVGHALRVRAPEGRPLVLDIAVTTDAAALTPLAREEIFNPAFFAFYEGVRAGADEDRFRRLERQVRGVELLSSREKLMAGLPNYATYFGRDMLVTALLMQPIWAPTMNEHVIGSVLGKLGPQGDVSHEEALGGQAIREHAARYNALLTEPGAGADPERLERAAAILGDMQRTREAYHMVDDDFQFPILVARYLADDAIPATRKREFLDAPAIPGTTEPRITRLLRSLMLVAERSAAYARDPVPAHLVAFPEQAPGRYYAASWRDSGAGYGNGRFAMDVNVIWVPLAVEATGAILAGLRELGYDDRAIRRLAPGIAGSALGGYLEDPESLTRTVATWRAADRHFTVRLSADEARARIDRKLAVLPADEARYWRAVLDRSPPPPNGLRFLALALDRDGQPVPILNTDVATRWFLEPITGWLVADPARLDGALHELTTLFLPYPTGLMVDGLGPLIANDAFADATVWAAFEADDYHSPRVVWGREVNLVLMGLMRQLEHARAPDGRPRDDRLGEWVEALNRALRQTVDAVEASRLKHNEVWSYRIDGSRLQPVRWGASTDVQLWNLTDLAIDYLLAGQ